MGCARSVALPRASRLFWSSVVVVATLKAILLFAVLPFLLRAAPDAYLVNTFSDEYDAIAVNLLEGRGYRVYPETSETMLRTPGWVLILAAIFAVAGKSLFAVQVFNLLISLVGGWGVYRLTLRITGVDVTAVVATTVYLLYPATVLAESRGGLESAFTTCAILFMLVVYRALSSYAYRDYLVAGVLFGIGLLIKSTLAFALPALFIWLVLSRQRKPDFRRLVSLFAVAAVTATLILSPWIIRNYRISGEFVATMSSGGTTAFQGLWVVKNKGSGKAHMELLSDAVAEEERIAKEMGLAFKEGFFLQFYSPNDEIDFYAELGRRARNELLSSPKLALQTILHNFVGFWIQGRTPRTTFMNVLLVLPFLAVSLIGFIIARRQGLPVAPVVLLMGTFIAPHLPILGVARYHVPMVPFLAVFVAVAFSAAAARLWPKPSS